MKILNFINEQLYYFLHLLFFLTFGYMRLYTNLFNSEELLGSFSISRESKLKN
jgi:hypothetical protein